MSTAAFNLKQFISTVKRTSFARVNRFELILTAPPGLASYADLTKTSMYCEVTNFPPLALSVKPFKIFGPSYQRPITSEYGGDGMSMTFHVDRDMRIKRLFDDWLEFIVDRNNFTVAYQEDYATKLYIRQLDEANNVTYEIELIDAFPRSMTLMDLNNSAQNQTHRLNVIFAYRYWRRTDIPANQRTTREVPPLRFDAQPIVTPKKNNPISQSVVKQNNNVDGSVKQDGIESEVVAP